MELGPRCGPNSIFCLLLNLIQLKSGESASERPCQCDVHILQTIRGLDGIARDLGRLSGGLRRSPAGERLHTLPKEHTGPRMLTWDRALGWANPPRSDKLPRKEVIQPQLPLRLPCYDFVPVTSPTLGRCLPVLLHTGLAHGLQVLPAPMT